MDIITYALSKKGIINVDGKQYKPKLKNGEIVYKKVEEPGDYTTFTVGEAGETTGTMNLYYNEEEPIYEVYINNVPQELPTGKINGFTGEPATVYEVKEGDIIKIRGGFSLFRTEVPLEDIVIQDGLKNCEGMFSECPGLTEAPIIPEGVENCEYMFDMCENLTVASEIPEGVISCEGMYDYTGITKAPRIPSSVINCGFMFDSCTSLTEAPAIPSSVTDCRDMFYECTSLTEAPIIPSSVTDCSEMFYGCTSLTTLPSENVALLSNHPDELAFGNCYSGCANIINPITIDDIPVAWGGNKVEKPEIPETPEEPTREYTTFIIKGSGGIRIDIGDVAEPAITELYINGEQQELPEHEAMYHVEEGQEVKIKGHFKLREANIERVELQSNLTDCSHMFEGCELLVAPEIPEGVTSCSSMFNGCTSLTEAPVIPSSVTNCSRMFEGCRSLTEAPVIPNSVTNCGDMFSGCTSLTEAPVIPEGVTKCNGMFDRCESLTEAPVIPSSVTICTGMFYGCTSLTEAPVIPLSVTSCHRMFRDCSNLTTLPSENIDLINNHPDELQHGSCYSGCEKINDPISYDEIPNDWK